jgi:hypothetical protein
LRTTWQARLEAVGKSQRELAAAIKYAEGTVSDLVKKNMGSDRLKDDADAVLKGWERASPSEVKRTSASETHQVAKDDSPEYKTHDEWKAEALRLRTEVTRLKVVIQILASTARPVSSSEAVDAEEFVTDIVNRIAAQAAAKSPPGPPPKS